MFTQHRLPTLLRRLVRRAVAEQARRRLTHLLSLATTTGRSRAGRRDVTGRGRLGRQRGGRGQRGGGWGNGDGKGASSEDNGGKDKCGGENDDVSGGEVGNKKEDGGDLLLPCSLNLSHPLSHPPIACYSSPHTTSAPVWCTPTDCTPSPSMLSSQVPAPQDFPSRVRRRFLISVGGTRRREKRWGGGR